MTPENTALWLTSRRGTFRVGPAPYPAPGPREVVVEAHAMALNPVDAMPAVTRALVYRWLRHPAVLGTDVAGVVVAVGPTERSGPDRLEVGDRVVGFATGQEKFRNDPAYGAFQRFVVLSADLTARVPDDVRLVDAAVLPLGLATAGAGLFEADQLGLALPGSEVLDRAASVLVWGASTSVGNNAVQLAGAAGYRVVATAGPQSFARVRDLGAAEVVDYADAGAVEALVGALDGHRLAGTVAIGQGSLPAALRVARRTDGTRRVASAYPGPATAVRRLAAQRYGVRVSAIWGGTPAVNPVGPALFRDFLPAALADGRLRPAPAAEVVGHELGAIPAALLRLQSGVHGRKLVVSLGDEAA